MKSMALVALFSSLFAAGPALGNSIFYDNFDASPAYSGFGRNIADGTTVNYNDPAYQFTSLLTGSVSTIEIGLRNTQLGTFKLDLATNAFDSSVLGTGQKPFTTLGSWTISAATLSAFRVVTINNISGVTLTAGQAYWLHATPISGYTVWANNEINASGPLYQCNGVGCGSHVSFASAPTGMMRIVGEAGAVPEPEVWAMMIVGFGAIGVVMRSRNKIVSQPQ
jgi:hypothetical protein